MEMKYKRAARLLKTAFMIGVITDGLAVIPMVSDNAARILWGFESFPPMYKFAMSLAAVFMAAWTMLLLWAFWKPLERRAVALLTLFVLVSFIAVEIQGVCSGILLLDNSLPTMIMQLAWSFLMGYVYYYSRGKEQGV